MEEILASIRRIISEDEGGGNTSAPTTDRNGGGSDPAVSDAEADGGQSAADANGDAPNWNGNSFSDAAALVEEPYEVLELTEMIAEDGSVVTITPAGEDQPGHGAGGAADGGVDERYDADAGDDGDTAVPYGHSDHVPVAPPRASQLPTQPPIQYESAQSSEIGGYYVDEAEAAALLDESVESDAPDVAAAAESDGRDDDTRRATRVLRDETEHQASTVRSGAEEKDEMNDYEGAPQGERIGRTGGAAFAELAGDEYDDSLAQNSRIQEEDDAFVRETESALEDLVRQAVQPMLREWLERTLPQMVERIVRQEIKKLIERRGGL